MDTLTSTLAAGAGAAQTDAVRAALQRLNASGIDYLVGGAFAFARITGIAIATKDLDLFVRAADCQRVLDTFAAVGCQIATPFPHWLAKVHHPGGLIDVIFNSGNAQLPVDDEWFEYALPARVFGVPVHLVPIEETLCTKAFIMERERFDGADVIHLLRAAAEQIEWPRLLRRFGTHWPVLLSHLILFGYAYPGERYRIASVAKELIARLDDPPADAERTSSLCRGGMLSRAQYLVAFGDWGYEDARLPPYGNMTNEQLRIWTEAAPAPRARAGVDPSE